MIAFDQWLFEAWSLRAERSFNISAKPFGKRETQAAFLIVAIGRFLIGRFRRIFGNVVLGDKGYPFGSGCSTVMVL